MKVSQNKNVSSKLKKKFDELVALDTDDSSPVTHVVASRKEAEQLNLAICVFQRERPSRPGGTRPPIPAQKDHRSAATLLLSHVR
jgi:hypothetical protein